MARGGRKRQINEYFFDNIVTEQQAYCLGFLFADGYIHKNGKNLGCEIASQDKDILVKILACMEADYPIAERKERNSSQITISSVHMVRALAKHGLMANKSLIAVPPNLDIPLQRHFWRGCFDGDGYINSKFGRVYFVGSYDMVCGFQSFVREVDHDNPSLVRAKENIFEFSTEGKRAKKGCHTELCVPTELSKEMELR